MNRSAVYDLLRELGFEVEPLFFSDYPNDVKGAHEAISKAALLIGPHGAGFANLVALQPNTAVIEFHSANFQRIVYGRLATVLGLKYNPILVPEKDTVHTEASRKAKRENDQWRHRDITIDLTILRESLVDVIEHLDSKGLW